MKDTRWLPWSRSWALAAACGVCVGCASVHGSEDVARTDTQLTIRIDGGNAFVYGDHGKRVDVGAVAVPGGDMHHMRLVLTRGEIQSASSGLSSAMDEARRQTWALQGYEVSVCPGGVCPSTSTLTSSPDRPPKAQCDPTQDQPDPNLPVDNMHYVPNLLDMHPGSRLKSNWRQLLDSRLVLRAGRLTVQGAIGCFTFDGAAPPRIQSIADGEAGMRYDVTVPETFVDLVFKRDGTPDQRLRLRPKSGERTVTLLVSAGSTSEVIVPNQLIPHFDLFYRLIDLAAVPDGKTAVPMAPAEPLKMRYTPVNSVKGPRGENVTPGGECPPVRFGDDKG